MQYKQTLLIKNTYLPTSSYPKCFVGESELKWTSTEMIPCFICANHHDPWSWNPAGHVRGYNCG